MKKLLLQLDPDRHPSAFDRIVAYDAGADEVLSYGGVTAADVTPLVHGAIFTRGPADLRHTAVWVGGTDVGAAEALFAAVQKAFFGPFRVSAMMDANGCNTTAAAAVARLAGVVTLSGGPGRDPGRHRTGRGPGRGLARARGRRRRAVLAVPRAGAGRRRAPEGDLRRRASRRARRGTRPASRARSRAPTSA